MTTLIASGKIILVKLLRTLGLKEEHVHEAISVERIEAIRKLSQKPLAHDSALRRVEIVMLKYKEAPGVINRAVANVIHRTQWPFRFTIYDNRQNPPNMAKIWNRLVRQSPCEYVLFMDTDAYVPDLEPCWLTRMMESIDEKDIVVPLGDNVSGINRATAPESYPASVAKPGIWTAFCFLFKKSLWEREPFDEEFFMYGQDSEWAARLSRTQGGVVLRRDVLVHHLHGYSAKKAQKEGELDRAADGQYALQLYGRKGVTEFL